MVSDPTGAGSTTAEMDALASQQLEQMLLSADHFCDLHASDLTVEIRRTLLDRLGMFGVRLCVREIRDIIEGRWQPQR